MDGLGSSGTGGRVLASIGPSPSPKNGRDAAERSLQRGELAQACDIPSHMASEPLMLMKRCGFLNASREGRNVFYSVKEPHLSSIMACIQSRFGEEA